ncbi:MAG: ATP-binding protein [Oscillospiraceae bacterium]|nr:ATP-binding protein [Oscillospiraceae bacterium]MCL2279121.1 ATP-binding protein [Oscillospiraceae bacterium]
MIVRTVQESVRKEIEIGRKAVVLLGARQVGKTTLLRSLFEDNDDVLWLNGDTTNARLLLTMQSVEQLRVIIGKHKVLVIDEAQRVPDIGIVLKLIIDNIPQVRVVATGSSSLDLANKTTEPLTGRKRQLTLFTLSFAEMTQHHGLLSEKNLIPHRLIYGYYPDIVNSPGEERRLLQELSDSYLYKDILALDKIKKSEHLTRLLRALAFQIGSQVSYTELGQLCGLDNKTVEKYIGILEQTFVIFRLGSYSRNLRNELKTSRKIYFADNGIRNALIADFRSVELRDDVGKLWENFLVSERFKRNEYAESYANSWFWRTQAQQEIDYIEEQDGHLSAFGFKWNPSAKVKQPKAFQTAYPDSSFTVIHKDNIESFLL